MVTPVLIPNTEVKHRTADDTLRGKVGSRQNQVFNFKKSISLTVRWIFWYTFGMSWAGKRQLVVLGIILGFFIILGLIFIVPKISKEPTCFDGRKNGEETGVDCGGTCPTFCPFEINDIAVHWSRVFEVSYGIYNVVAYVENQNTYGAVYDIPYEFKLYDKDNVFIAERKGKTFLEPNKNSGIFESRIFVGDRIPKRVTFNFLEDPSLIKVDKKLQSSLQVFAQEKIMTNVGSSPKLSATIVNDSLYNIPDLDIVAILYNKEGNAIAASQTLIDPLRKNTSEKIFFTWSKPFTEQVFKIEIIPRINIFSISF